LVAGIEIGTRIRLRGYTTLVADHQECFSACAIAWLGGSSRLVGSQANIGFHAAYIEMGESRLETGVGNALVGAYASRLGLGDAAVIFITSAPPDVSNRLTELEAQRVGIAAEFLDAGEIVVTQSPHRDQVAQPDVPVPASELEWREPYSRWAMGWLSKFYNEDYVVLTGKNINWRDPPFEIATLDLRLDQAEPENSAILVKWKDARFCSPDGCFVDIWVSKNNKYLRSGSFLGERVLIADSFSSAYRDILIDDSVLRWDETEYAADPQEADRASSSATLRSRGARGRPVMIFSPYRELRP
jgi:hypothetical protein